MSYNWAANLVKDISQPEPHKINKDNDDKLSAIINSLITTDDESNYQTIADNSTQKTPQHVKKKES